MILQERIMLMSRLGEYMLGNDPDWLGTKDRAYRENQWFVPAFIDRATENIGNGFLKPSFLQEWVASYSVAVTQQNAKTVGLVMAGNIPLVGFHDLLSVFISGHRSVIKLSSKDEVLTKHLLHKLTEWEPAISGWVSTAERLNGCDAYIATGSNNTGRYFDYYFGKYPHIIRKNRTSVGVLDDTETPEELNALAEDMMLYFGLGCRSITKIYVPRGYDFLPLLDALRRYGHFIEYHKYKHNFDYHLALLIMGNKYYMTNDTVIFTENTSPFSPVSQVHFEYYTDGQLVKAAVTNNPDLQCVTGHGYIPFGQAQKPSLSDYPDGVDTMQFLTSL